MTPHFVTKLTFEDDGGFPFTLTQDLVYVTEVRGVGKPVTNARIIRVPAGFKTDLASIPKVLWSVLPPIGKYDAPAVLHDALYQFDAATRKQADDVLYEAMKATSVGWRTRWTIYAGVRVGGWKSWNGYRHREV